MIAFDCHAHVYETVTPIKGARYVPSAPAPLADWQAHLQQRGLKGGVIVQVSFLGTNNAQMCSALAQLDRSRFAGVGAVALDVSEAELERLAAAGMRGVRWNLVGGARLPDLGEQKLKLFLRRLRARDMHLEIQIEGPRLAKNLPALSDLGVNIVVDHFGLPSTLLPKDDPMIQAVSALKDRSSLYFKFTAPYRVQFDVRPHGEELLSLLPTGHVVWGSDWPHTQHESRTSYSEVWSASSQWRELSDKAAVRRLYGIA